MKAVIFIRKLNGGVISCLRIAAWQFRSLSAYRQKLFYGLHKIIASETTILIPVDKTRLETAKCRIETALDFGGGKSSITILLKKGF